MSLLTIFRFSFIFFLFSPSFHFSSPQFHLHCFMVPTRVWGGVLPALRAGWGSAAMATTCTRTPDFLQGLRVGSPHPPAWLTCWLTPHPTAFKVWLASSP